MELLLPPAPPEVDAAPVLALLVTGPTDVLLSPELLALLELLPVVTATAVELVVLVVSVPVEVPTTAPDEAVPSVESVAGPLSEASPEFPQPAPQSMQTSKSCRRSSALEPALAW